MALPMPVVDWTTPSPERVAGLQREVRRLAARRHAVILSHNYQRAEVQDVADYVGDSLGLSREAAATDADVIVFCGVHFMAETAAILSPGKRVLLPHLEARCSLAASITARDVRRWRTEYPDHVVVGYVNTSADVKAEVDYCCTSGNVLDVIDAIPEERGILFLPDFFLGAHIKRERPTRRVRVWMGECHVHRGIKARTVNARRRQYPDAEVLVHPECECAGQVVDGVGLDDVDGRGVHIASTEGMIRAAQTGTARRYIVATEIGILHRLRQIAPEKDFVPADPQAVCQFMKVITLENVRDALRDDRYVVTVPAEIAARARGAIDRMVALG